MMHPESAELLARALQSFPKAAEKANLLPGQSVLIVDGRSPQGRELGMAPEGFRFGVASTSAALELAGETGAPVATMLLPLLPGLRVVVVLSETRVAVIAHPCGPLPLDLLTRAA